MKYLNYFAVAILFWSAVLMSCDKHDVRFIVSFDSNEGSIVFPQTIKEGEKATKPDAPTRSGYAFDAWYKDVGLKDEWRFDIDVVTANITLYAKWEQNVFTVSFISNEGSAVLPQTVKRGETVAKPVDPTRNGHTFASWYTEMELINNWDFMVYWVTADMILYAKWNTIDPLFKITGLTMENYPSVDGSTSTGPLNTLIACKLLDIGYDWRQSPSSNMRFLEPGLNKEDNSKFVERVKSSQTHESFINLIDNKADFILSARSISSDEKEYANAASVSLIETPVALDAFIFIVHPSNPVYSLTTKQIQDIYTGKITNWKEIGGRDAKINPYVRDANSGSQELMESLVMQGLDIADFSVSKTELYINTMIGVYDAAINDPSAICYSIHYYKEQIVPGYTVKTIAIDGIYPDKENIGNGSYPHIAEVYATIRSDLDKSSMAYKLYELLLTEAGKRVVAESGYVPD
jgi:phosphate transport system substrate-binding protein